MSPKKRIVLGCAVGATAMLAVTGCGVTNQSGGTAGSGDGPFYEGQTINLIVPFDAGGTSDGFSRLVAGYLSEHLEGNPEIVVDNIPGGGQKEGLNAFERAEHDGLTLAMASGGILVSTLFDTEGIEFDPGDYETLAAFGGGMSISASVAAGVDSLEDLVERDETTYYGGMVLNASEAVRVFALDQFGMADFETLMGYDGGGSVTTAVLRGELTLGNTTSGHYRQNVQPLEEDGDVVRLMTQGYVVDGEVVREPASPDLPSMPEAYEMLTGETAEGPGWDIYTAITTAQTNLLRNYWVHGDAPEDAKAALHEAIAQVVEDEAFLEEASELLLGEPPVLVGEEAAASMEAARDLSDEQVKWLEDYIDEVSAR